jgi:hypothetical protein
MREHVKQRLSKTPEGQAIIGLVEHAGGWDAFLRATGFIEHDLTNWYRRGKISQLGAYLIEEIPFFADAGWTKEKVLPSVGLYQWKEKADLLARAVKPRAGAVRATKDKRKRLKGVK